MSAGDTWVAKIEGTTPRYIRVRAYDYNNNIVEEFTIEMPSDDETYIYYYANELGLVVRDNTFCCCSGYYFYTVKLDTYDVYTYKYATGENLEYWYSAYNNNKFSFVILDTAAGYGYWRTAYFDSPDGITWIKQIDYDDFPSNKLIFSAIYNSYDGKYWFSIADYYSTYPAVRTRQYTLEWTTDFSTFTRVEPYRPYHDLNITNDSLYFRYWESDTTTISKIVKYAAGGKVTIYTPTGTPSGLKHWNDIESDYGTINVDPNGRLYVLIGEYNASNVYQSTGLYVFDGTTFDRVETLDEGRWWDKLWPISNYRVGLSDTAVANKNYNNTVSGTTSITTIYGSPFEIPLVDGTSWSTYYLETGAGVETSFWCEYDDCSETASDY